MPAPPPLAMAKSTSSVRAFSEVRLPKTRTISLPMPSLFAKTAERRDRMPSSPATVSQRAGLESHESPAFRAPTPSGSGVPTPSGSESRESPSFVLEASSFDKFFEPLTDELRSVDELPPVEELPSAKPDTDTLPNLARTNGKSAGVPTETR